MATPAVPVPPAGTGTFCNAMSCESLWGGLTFSPGAGFPLSTDSMVLADFVRLPRDARVADLGSGSGVLGLLLCGRFPDCTVTGLELRQEAHLAALDNIARNRLDRLSSVLGDLRQTEALLPAGSFDCVVSNPPYFSGGAPSETLAGPQARQELACTLADVFRGAARLLRFGGDFWLVHRPERLADLMALGREYRLEPKRLQLVRHRPEKPACLVLLQCRRGGKPGLRLLPDLVLFHPDGTPTDRYREIYHLNAGG